MRPASGTVSYFFLLLLAFFVAVFLPAAFSFMSWWLIGAPPDRPRPQPRGDAGILDGCRATSRVEPRATAAPAVATDLAA
jgi:hypothetical protein